MSNLYRCSLPPAGSAEANGDNDVNLNPRTDGRENGDPDSFRVLGSRDLTEWTDVGEGLRLGRAVPWADRNASSTAAAYRNGLYFSFTADDKIGVAAAASRRLRHAVRFRARSLS